MIVYRIYTNLGHAILYGCSSEEKSISTSEAKKNFPTDTETLNTKRQRGS